MGASVAVVVALIFSGFLIVGTIIYSSVDYSKNLVKKAQYDQDTMKKAKMQTDITITNVTDKTTGNITLKNTGKTTLNASLLDVFVDGAYYNYALSSASNNIWTAESNVNITLSPAISISGKRVKVVTENGISDYVFVP